MLRNLIVMLLFLVGCANNQSQQSIVPIKSIKEIDFNAIKSGNTLVIFDVDATLIQPEDTYLINEHKEQGKKFRENLIGSNKQVKDWGYVTSVILRDAKRPLIEPIVTYKIKELQSRNIPVIAFTGMNTGSMGFYKSLEQWRYEHLKSLGFEGSFSNMIFKLKGFKRNPGFYKGLLSSDLESKGKVLGVFLKTINFQSTNIIMIDDDLDYLVSVQTECKKRNITFKGYHYQAAISKPWDEKLIQFQAEYLLKNKRWLSDEEARKMISNL